MAGGDGDGLSHWSQAPTGLPRVGYCKSCPDCDCASRMRCARNRNPYESYFAGAQFINFLLGPATIALAVPLARNLVHVKRNLHSIGVALLAGSITSIVSGVAMVWALGGSRDLALSMATKAVSTPISMAVSEEIGGIPALTAALAIMGGIVAVVGEQILRRLRIHDWRAHGFAAGVAGSGVAAAQIASRNELGAAFAGLGIALNGLLTALIVPFVMMIWR